MKRGQLIDTEELIGRKNRAAEEGEAPEEFVMRESPYTVLELVGLGIAVLVAGFIMLGLHADEDADVLGWVLTVLGIAALLVGRMEIGSALIKKAAAVNRNGEFQAIVKSCGD